MKIDTHFYTIYFWKSETFANHHMHLLYTVSPWEDRARMRLYLPGRSPFCIYIVRDTFLCSVSRSGGTGDIIKQIGEELMDLCQIASPL